jgi:primosomal protein N' (replication factor Y)
MIAKVVPAVRLPYRASQIYDYNIPENLSSGISLGCGVAIPFAGRIIAGLVMAVEEKTGDRDLKDVYGFLDGIIYPKYWTELLPELADEFATTMPRLVWTVLPHLMRKSVLTCCASPFVQPGGRSATAFEEKIIAANAPEDLLTEFNRAVREGQVGQTLVLVPTVPEAEAWSKEASGAAVYNSRLSDGAKYSLAAACALGETKVVVGTKSAVFLPFRDLRSILVLRAGASAHLNEDLDPRYDARVVARRLAQAAGAELSFVDALPPLALGKTTNSLASIDDERLAICDLADAGRREKAKVLLTDRVVEAAKGTLANGGRALFLLNRRGTGSSLICADCGKAALCPNCGVPLLSVSDETQCYACGKTFPAPASCDKCRGVNFKTVGTGVKALYNYLRKIFPDARSVLCEGGGEKADLNDFNLVIGTTAVFHALKPRFKRFELVCDALLGAGTGMAGIYAVEETARILNELKLALTPDGRLFVQTYDPAAPALLSLTDPQAFIAKELGEREAFNYPPYGKIVKAIGAGKVQHDVFEQARTIKTELQRSGFAEVGEPLWNAPKLFRGKYRLSIAAKAGPRQNVDNLVKYLPNGWSAEIREL